MPHAGGGGGGGGGGFHSSSSGSSGSSSKPRYDSYGRLHSTYYVRPGFYYNSTYVPYSGNHRMLNAIIGPIIGMIIVFALTLFISFNVLFGKSYDEGKLEDYAIDKYSDVYNKNSNSYEYNILIAIVTYEEGAEFDYISIVGDEINHQVDLMFGNQRTTFGGSIYGNINSSYTDIYEAIAYGLNNVSDLIPQKYYSSNSETSKVLNESEYQYIGNSLTFKQAEENFYDKTGYHVSILVTENNLVYTPDYSIIVVMCILFGVTCLICISLIRQKVKAVKAVNKAIDEGDAKKYYEGEVDLEEYMKTNSYMKNKRNLNG